MPTTDTKTIPQGYEGFLTVEDYKPDGSTIDTTEPITATPASASTLETQVGDLGPPAEPGGKPTFTANAATGRSVRIFAKLTGNPSQVNTSVKIDAPGVNGANELTVPVECPPPPPNNSVIQATAYVGPFAPPEV